MTPIAPDLLECLAAIVEEGGFERAAKRLSITQSAVSQRLQTLEAQVGTLLIVRGKPLRATPAGRLLLKHAMQVFLLHADLVQDLRQIGSGDASLAAIGGAVEVGSVGSGDVEVRGAASLTVRSVGSGDIDHRDVRGAVNIPRRR